MRTRSIAALVLPMLALALPVAAADDEVARIRAEWQADSLRDL